MSAEAPRAERRVTLGRIAGVYGIKGWVKLVSSTRPPEGILRYPRWWLSRPGSPEGYEAKLLEGRIHGAGLVAQISQADGSAIEDRDSAARLVGLEIAVPRSALPPAGPNEVYLMDLIGMAVRSVEGEGLGRVESVTSNGAQDVLVLRDPVQLDEAGAPLRRLIPFVRGPIIESVSLEANEIVAHWQPDW